MKTIILTSIVLVVGALASCQKNNQPQDEAFFQKIKTEKVTSDASVEWKNFGPGMSGYCEEFWCHPTDTNVMFMGPDMHVSFGTWDNGKSWHSIKDHDGLGQDMKRVLDIAFSLQNPDYGMSIDWNGWVFQTIDRGRSWQRTGAFGDNYEDIGVDPNDSQVFKKGWYAEQRGTRHSELAVDPTNDQVWYVGAGDFWNVKSNHRTAAEPNGTTLKYAAYGYIWKTVDQGKTWKKITNGLPKNTEVGKIIVHPANTNRVVMMTNVGLMTSNDSGLTWQNNVIGLPNNLPRDLTYYYDQETKEFVLYLVDQTVYQKTGKTITSTGGVYKSVDAGANWTNITANLALNLNLIHAPAETRRYFNAVAYWFGEDKNKLEKECPQLPKAILPVYNRIVVNPLDKDEIYLSYNKKHDRTFGPGDVWKTSDGGKSWVVCARQGAYWKSGADEKYWKKRNNPVGINVKFAHLQRYMDHESEKSGNRMMTINSIGQVFIGLDQQTVKTSNHGKTWEQVDDDETSQGSNKWIGRGGSNLPGRFMLHETGIKGRRLLCSGEHGLWQTTDLDGWKDQQAVAVEQIEGQNNHYGAHSISTVAVHPNDPNIIYILMWRQEHRGKLRKSIDGGKTWENIATIFEAPNNSWQNLAQQASLSIDPINPENMYFCSIDRTISEVDNGRGPELSKGGYGFYRSHDAGLTWTLSNEGFHEKASIRRIVLDPHNPEIIYAASNDHNGGLYKSIDKGQHWGKVKIPAVIKAVNNVFIDRNTNDLLIATGRRGGTYEEGGVWRSADNGVSWKQIFKAPFVWQAEISPINPALIVISVGGQSVNLSDQFLNPGVYLSQDNGVNWKKINKGLGQPDKIVDIRPDPYNKDVLWCASWGCGWFVTYLNGASDGWLKE